MATSGKRTARRVETKNWRERAIRLHIDGWSYRDIAKKLGLALSTVHEGVEAEIKAIPAGAVADLREVEGARLEVLIRGHIKKARAGDAEAAHVVIAAIRQRGKLFGLEAPTRTQMSGPNGGPIPTMAFDLSKLTDEQLDRVLAGDLGAFADCGPSAPEGGGEGGEKPT